MLDGLPDFMSQLELVEQARRGDHEAFAALAGATIPRLDAIARLILRDYEQAKDAVQETLVRAWRDLPSLRDPARFDAWLYRLLVNACTDEARRKRRFSVEVELHSTHHPTTRDSAVSVAERDALERGFRRLDAEQRALVVMHHYLDLPLNEVAEVVGIPLGTAKSRLHRALSALRAALEADLRTTTEYAEGRLA